MNNQSTDLDVVVVGAGFTRLTAARNLAKAGVSVVVLETDDHRRHPPDPVAEFLGTALLVAVVVGSGIAAQKLSPPTPVCSSCRTR